MKKLTKSDMFWTFVRSNYLQGSWNFERMQALGYCFGMIPVLKRLYDGDELKAALKRHLEFYNTQPFMTAPIIGITAALEEQRANGQNIGDGVINGLKVGMMGPLAGVGDPVFWGTLRPMLAALGASLALGGNVLGPIVFFVLFNAVRLAMRWYGIRYGYDKGVGIVKDIGGNKLQKLTEGASILGLFIMGALVSKWTTLNIPLVISSVTMPDGSVATTTVQSILDQLLPGLAPLALTFICMALLRRKVNAIWLIFGLFAVGIAGYATGVLQ